MPFIQRFAVLIALVVLVGIPQVRAQTNATLSGYVTDATSGETLLLANVRLIDTRMGAATNNSGYYTLAGIAPGEYRVAFSYIGYTPEVIEVTLSPGETRRLDVALNPEGVLIDEITVTAEAELEEEIRRVGVLQMQTELIRQLPSVLQPDVFRSLQLLPGVKAASDYSSGLYIRGGSHDQTLILMDRTTVYNPSHFFGFFSTFNPDAIKDVRLYKGGYPARYGGRLGSVVDIYNRDGNRNEFEGGVSLGLLSSRAIVEGPYSRGSWMFAVRRSTLEPLLYALRESGVDDIPDAFHFYDVNGKVNLDLSRSDRLSLSFYAGSDALEIEFLSAAQADLTYGNRTASLNWTHLFSDRLFSNFTATGSRYASTPELEFGGTLFEQENTVGDASLKGDFEYIPNERHSLEAGFWTGMFTFRLRNVFDGSESLRSRIRSGYASLYVQERYRPNASWDLIVGLRANYFQEGGFVRLAPRLSAEYHPSPSIRLQAAVGRYYQFLTLITSELFSGFDTWLTTGDGIPPSFGDHVVLGVKTALPADVNLDVEAYYRTMSDLFELDPFIPDPAGLDYQDIFRYGEGYAYGIEGMIARSTGRLNGFLAYTWSRTQRRFPNVNSNNYYFPKYDRTHDVHLVANYDLSSTWRASAVWSYATGQAYTEPVGQYKLVGDPFGAQVRDVLVTEYDFRLPPYHRLDLGISRRGTIFGWGSYELQLQVINAYNRRNIWFYFFNFEDDGTVEKNEVPQIPVPLPNIAFTLNF